MAIRRAALCALLLCLLVLTSAKKDKDKKPDWAKKDIRDYTDADLERLLDQWDVSGAVFT